LSIGANNLYLVNKDYKLYAADLTNLNNPNNISGIISLEQMEFFKNKNIF
jgi:hypothetical protein